MIYLNNYGWNDKLSQLKQESTWTYIHRTPHMLRGRFRKRSVSVRTDGEYDVWKIRL